MSISLVFLMALNSGLHKEKSPSVSPFSKCPLPTAITDPTRGSMAKQMIFAYALGKYVSRAESKVCQIPTLCLFHITGE